MNPRRWLNFFAGAVLAIAQGARGVASESELSSGSPVFAQLTAINDRQIDEILARPNITAGAYSGSREIGAQIMVLAMGHGNHASRFHHDAKLVEPMVARATVLRTLQLASGLFDSGNLESPPDTAFVVETLCKAQLILARADDATTAPVRAQLREIILAAAEGIRTGGVHTPNHRWHICATLAHIHELFPSPALVARIDDWLGEGIDLDDDGQFAERSPHYTAEVVNPALLNLGAILERPQYFDFVRRNLEESLALIEPNGEVETVASRRQDQRSGARQFIWDNYVAYRFFAIRDGNGTYAGLARWIEREFADAMLASASNPNAPLAFFFTMPELTREMPPSAALPENFTKLYRGMNLARVRRGAMSATIYGGSDNRSGYGTASGLAMNPTFFRMRKGAAVLESVRMTPSFFGTGFFYSEGLTADASGYHLRQTLDIPYHQPLPPEFRNERGDYALSPDGRYFSKLDFEHRPKQLRTLTSEVTVSERDGGFALEFSVEGHAGVPVTIELAFRKDGELSGATPLAAEFETMSAGAALRRRAGAATDFADTFVLKDGTGRFRAGDDVIEIGPGTFARLPGRMEGEQILWVNGSLRAEGTRVYITGATPFHHTLIVR